MLTVTDIANDVEPSTLPLKWLDALRCLIRFWDHPIHLQHIIRGVTTKLLIWIESGVRPCSEHLHKSNTGYRKWGTLCLQKPRSPLKHVFIWRKTTYTGIGELAAKRKRDNKLHMNAKQMRRYTEKEHSLWSMLLLSTSWSWLRGSTYYVYKRSLDLSVTHTKNKKQYGTDDSGKYNSHLPTS